MIETIKTLFYFIDEHPILGLAVAWFIYRLGLWNERKNLLESLEKELKVHKDWVGKSHEVTNIDDIRHMVFKIYTVSIDNAITRGAALLINRNLIERLLVYRQAVTNFVQIIETANNFRNNVELWDGKDPTIKDTPPKARVIDLERAVHDKGIGSGKDWGAHSEFLLLVEEIQKEKNSKILPILWAITGFNLFWLKEYICK